MLCCMLSLSTATIGNPVPKTAPSTGYTMKYIIRNATTIFASQLVMESLCQKKCQAFFAVVFHEEEEVCDLFEGLCGGV